MTSCDSHSVALLCLGPWKSFNSKEFLCSICQSFRSFLKTHKRRVELILFFFFLFFFIFDIIVCLRAGVMEMLSSGVRCFLMNHTC